MISFGIIIIQPRELRILKDKSAHGRLFFYKDKVRAASQHPSIAIGAA